MASRPVARARVRRRSPRRLRHPARRRGPARQRAGRATRRCRSSPRWRSSPSPASCWLRAAGGRRPRRDRASPAGIAASLGRRRDRRCRMALARDPCGRRRPPAERDLQEPPAAGGLPRRRRRDRGPVVPLRARSRRPGRPTGGPADGRLPPAPLRIGLRALGLIGWAWIVAQGIAGGVSNAEVTHAVPVGLRLGRRRDRLSAFVGPVWQFLDPFSTLYDIGAWILRRLASRLGHGRLPGTARAMAGGHRFPRASSGSSSSIAGAPVHAVRRSSSATPRSPSR